MAAAFVQWSWGAGGGRTRKENAVVGKTRKYSLKDANAFGLRKGVAALIRIRVRRAQDWKRVGQSKSVPVTQVAVARVAFYSIFHRSSDTQF